jgi:glycosyltransferase involved in cell wall biosynthesis
MKIGINLTALTPGQHGEAEAYVRAVLPHLAALDGENDYLLATGPANWRTLPPAAPRWQRVLYCGQEHAPDAYRESAPSAPPARPAWYRALRHVYRRLKGTNVRRWYGRLADLLARERVDLWFCPLTYALPVDAGVPVVPFVHDLQHEHYPHLFPDYELASRQLGYQYSCRAATAVLAGSRCVAQEISTRYGVDPSRVFPVPPAPYPSPDSSPTALRRHVGDVRLKYRLDGDFIFCPAHGLRHPDCGLLVGAMRRVARERPGLRLLVSGRPDGLRPLLREHGLEAVVTALGAVGRDDLLGLYAGCRLVVLPALAESAAQALLAALCLGAPAACSAGGSLHEVGGEAVLPFDPASEAQIADAVLALAADEALRRRLADAGRERAHAFSAAETARATLAAFPRVRDGALAAPPLPPFRPLGRQRLLESGHGRWFFRVGSLREVQLRVFQPQPPRMTAGQNLEVYLDGRQVLDTRLAAERACDFVVRAPADGEADFHSLELKTSTKHTFGLEPLPVQVLSVVAVDAARNEFRLVA